jgi:hypothetical protein
VHPLVVTRAIMCATCPDFERRGKRHDDGVCAITGHRSDRHILTGAHCPRGRHPNRHGLVTVTIAGHAVVTHHSPMWSRLWLLSRGGMTLRGFFRVPGCGCIVRLKRRARQALDLDLWWRVLGPRRKHAPRIG